jgi:hypothetical protein
MNGGADQLEAIRKFSLYTLQIRLLVSATLSAHSWLQEMALLHYLESSVIERLNARILVDWLSLKLLGDDDHDQRVVAVFHILS